MLAYRVIPTVLFRGTQLVKGEKFKSWRSIGNAMQAAQIYAKRDCDEIILLDIGATPEGRRPNLEIIEAWTEANFAPITVGGGIRSVKDVESVLRAGADKVAIGKAAFTNDYLVANCVQKFGSQAIVVAVNVEKNSAVEDAVTSVALDGCGEVLLTSIEREGTLQGYDIELIQSVSSAVNIPVIAHGGCSGPGDMKLAIEAGASAVAAGALFAFTDWTPKSCAEYLQSHGIETR